MPIGRRLFSIDAYAGIRFLTLDPSRKGLAVAALIQIGAKA